MERIGLTIAELSRAMTAGVATRVNDFVIDEEWDPLDQTDRNRMVMSAFAHSIMAAITANNLKIHQDLAKLGLIPAESDPE